MDVVRSVCVFREATLVLGLLCQHCVPPQCVQDGVKYIYVDDFHSPLGVINSFFKTAEQKSGENSYIFY